MHDFPASTRPRSTTLHASPPAAARHLRQPGPPQALRIQSRQAPRARHLRLQLQPGCSLFAALVQPLAQQGVHFASVTLLAGWLDTTHYCVSVPDPAGRALLTHSAPIAAGRCCLVTANATLAQGVDGQPLVHCHAALYSSAGAGADAPHGVGTMRGGHLLTQHCTVGEGGIVALVTCFDGFVLRATFDEETRLPLVRPHGVSDGDD